MQISCSKGCPTAAYARENVVQIGFLAKQGNAGWVAMLLSRRLSHILGKRMSLSAAVDLERYFFLNATYAAFFAKTMK